MKLKYPRRKKRKIGNKIYRIKAPNNKRSEMMAKIHGQGTVIELLLSKVLRKNKIKYKNGKALTGSPDFILKKCKIAIFCDGDFWHGYNSRYLKINRNKSFWYAKIRRNVERDQEVNKLLRYKGWKVFRFWEHEIKKCPLACVSKIKRYLILQKGIK